MDHLQIGDRVLLPTTARTFHERLVLPAKELFALPPEADPQQLAMLRINPPTASLLLSEYVALSPGEWVLQNAGNSGVGRWVITFARQRGLKTVSVIRRQELIDDLISAGGDVVLVDGADLARRVAQATGHAPIALGLDGVAWAAMQSLSSCLSPGGTLVVYAFMSEQPGQVNPADLIFRRVTMRGFWLEAPAVRGSPKVLEASKTGARLIAAGKLHLPIAAVYPLSAAKEAITRAQRGGKVLFACS